MWSTIEAEPGLKTGSNKETFKHVRTHRSQLDCSFADTPGPLWLGAEQAAGYCRGTRSDRRLPRTGGQTSQTQERWAGGLCRRRCDPPSPNPWAAAHTTRLTNCPVPWKSGFKQSWLLDNLRRFLVVIVSRCVIRSHSTKTLFHRQQLIEDLHSVRSSFFLNLWFIFVLPKIPVRSY